MAEYSTADKVEDALNGGLGGGYLGMAVGAVLGGLVGGPAGVVLGAKIGGGAGLAGGATLGFHKSESGTVLSETAGHLFHIVHFLK